MTTTGDAGADVAEWLDDLRWHRKMYGGARWRWWDEHVMEIVTGYTGGRLNFSAARDVAALRGALARADVDVMSARLAVARPLTRALAVIQDWDRIAAALGAASVAECSSTVWLAQGGPPPGEVSSLASVDRVREMVARLPFRNPLIEALELIQVWRVYEASRFMLEDTMCDLLVELSVNRPESLLAELTGESGVEGLRERISRQRLWRGKPGDVRRAARQLLSPG